MAAKSTNLLGDIGTVITNGPSTKTKAASIAAAGPINDYVGNCYSLQLELKGIANRLGVTIGTITEGMKGVTDSSDPNLTTLNGLLALINGTSNPSTQAITDAKSIQTTAPTAATKALAIAAGGEIMDIPGVASTVVVAFERVLAIATTLDGVTSTQDDATNEGKLASILAVLV